MSSLTTKKAIAYTFKDLLKEKPFNKITVNDIANKCDIIINKVYIVLD